MIKFADQFTEMKKAFAFLFTPLLILLVFTAIVTGCEKTGCKNMVCGTHQVCYNGNCYCENGREGSACELYSLDRWTGNYMVTEFCYTGTSPAPYYYVTITAGSRQDAMLIYNIGNSGTTLDARIVTSTVTSKGTHMSVYSNSGSVEMQGEGDYNETTNQIIWDGTIKQGFDSRQCQLTFIKQ